MAAPTGAAVKAMQELWTRTVAEVKREATQPALFRALEQTIVITHEDGQFVVGFGGTDAQIGSVLKTSQYQLQIERSLRRVSGDDELRLRVIDGNTYDDWEHTRRRDAAAVNRIQQTIQRQVIDAAAFGTWDELYEQVSRLWAQQENRSLMTARGRYLDSALELVLKAMEKLYPQEGRPEETAERGLSRVIERVATLASADPAIVAYLLFQRRK
ncbi:MAG: hypothetical protein SFU56_19910 [Capsulimonadales bacterium]|nr:hypothetical protein [Capsulimonadales bacterium]